jgi:hypothetical protein
VIHDLTHARGGPGRNKRGGGGEMDYRFVLELCNTRSAGAGGWGKGK